MVSTVFTKCMYVRMHAHTYVCVKCVINVFSKDMTVGMHVQLQNLICVSFKNLGPQNFTAVNGAVRGMITKS